MIAKFIEAANMSGKVIEEMTKGVAKEKGVCPNVPS